MTAAGEDSKTLKTNWTDSTIAARIVTITAMKTSVIAAATTNVVMIAVVMTGVVTIVDAIMIAAVTTGVMVAAVTAMIKFPVSLYRHQES